MSAEPTPPPIDDTIGRQLLKQAEALAQLRRRVDELAEEATESIATLLLRLEAAEERSDGGRGRSPQGWCWRHLGPHAVETLTVELTGWVDWLRCRYPLARRIPACWADHPEIVEELTALWLAWQAAYTEPDPPLTAAADWHDRWLPGVLHRLEHGPFALACGEEHRARPSSAYLIR
jgi:hypothetical protein